MQPIKDYERALFNQLLGGKIHTLRINWKLSGTVTMKIPINLMLPFCLLLVAPMLSGCSTTDVVTFDSATRAPVAVDEVEVLLEKPQKPYKVIARIQFGPDAFVADYQSQTNEVVKLAAGLGADAVIVSYDSEVTGYTGGNATTGVYGGTTESKFTVGQAIVYEQESDEGT